MFMHLHDVSGQGRRHAFAGLEAALSIEEVDVNQEDQDGTKLLHVAAGVGALKALKVNLFFFWELGSHCYQHIKGMVMRQLVPQISGSAKKPLEGA